MIGKSILEIPGKLTDILAAVQEIKEGNERQLGELKVVVEKNTKQIDGLKKSAEKNEKKYAENNKALWAMLNQYINCHGKKNENNFMAAIPDSLNHFNRYPEYDTLYPLFIEKNTENNIRDFTRLYMFILNINRILSSDIQGSFAEVGVYKGNNCAVMMEYCKKYGRKLFMFDTFEGFDNKDLTGVDSHKELGKFGDTSLEEVKKYVGENEHSRYIKGFFPESATAESKEEVYAFVSLDCDLYQPIKAGLSFFYPRLGSGGMIFIHDYSSGFYEGCTKAVDEFCRENHVSIVLMPDKSGTAVLVKS